MSDTKECIACHEIKPVNEFTKDKSRKDGLHTYCKTCKYYPKGIEERPCSKCGKVKNSRDDFYPSQTCCKECFKIHVKENNKNKDIPKPRQSQLPFQPIQEPEPAPEPEHDFKTCERCNELRPLTDYHVNNQKQCRFCVQELKSERMDNVHEFLKDKWHRAKGRAAKKNIEFTITLDQWYYIFFVIQRGLCALCGLFMTHKASAKLDNDIEKFPFNISPDRKDSTKGYTFENVQFVRWCLNSAKNDMEQGDFIQMCGQVWEYQKSKQSHWTPET